MVINELAYNRDREDDRARQAGDRPGNPSASDSAQGIFLDGYDRRRVSARLAVARSSVDDR
jgi:hypothetical protein